MANIRFAVGFRRESSIVVAIAGRKETKSSSQVLYHSWVITMSL